MSQKQYMIFFSDLTRSVVKAENILGALQSVPSVENVIRVSLYEKDKVVISSQIVDEDFDEEYRPPTTT